ncbi:protein argonaute 4B [Triticum aestivum]|uniref:protein argonaute 4B n=1 Tax=Triticum aestivum TaxID=4565 RepID=UPI001D00584A|nr:protein argonaute 4B-like [Triticum aestivum]
MNPSDGGSEELPPPPALPPDMVPIKAEEDVAEELPPNKPAKTKRLPKARPGLGKRGQTIQLLANHYKVSMRSSNDFFHHYHVNLKYGDDQPVVGKEIVRKVLDKLQHMYRSELANNEFAYDGEKSLFTIEPLYNEFTVVLEDIGRGKCSGGNSGSSPGGSDTKRVKRSYQTKIFKVELCFVAKIPTAAITQALRGQESENSLEALRVLHIILRQHSAKQGCLLLRQSFFHNNPRNFLDLKGGVVGCRGFHSSFRGTQSGLSLNIDVSTTMLVKPGPVIDFLLANQMVDHPNRIDWSKAKRALKNLRIKTTLSNSEFKIFGLSEKKSNEQTFPLRRRDGDNGDTNTVEIKVYEYFVHNRGIGLRYSDLPCINAGRRNRPTYFPLELCELVPLQRYTKDLSILQRSSLVEKSRQKPHERMSILNDALKRSNYESDPMLKACDISIARHFTQIEGRVLPAPKLKAGNGEEFFPRNGRWNLSKKRLIQTCSVNKWAVVNFSAECDVHGLVRDLIRIATEMGIKIEYPYCDVIEESPSARRAPASRRVDEMFAKINSNPPGDPKFLLCLLPDRKNCEIYGPWKRKCLAECGIFTQCLAPPRKVNDQYLINVLLKINAKLGGLNTLLQCELSPAPAVLPIVGKLPTIILGMNVSHGQPGQSDRPSTAAVVNSRQWPLISKYRATVHTQSPKLEMMSSLFEPRGKKDDGLIRESLIDFYSSSGNRKPEQIIIFRDGVSESQFTQVINIELEQIIEACKFRTESPNNVPPGTVVDKEVCHPKNFDFYMCAHAGMIGTSRPTHYHVLHDEIGFSADELQEFVHSLSYVYQRSTTAISVVAPIMYAHLAAAQVGAFVKFEDMSAASSSQGGGHTSAGSIPVPELHKNVRTSMFFC